MNNDFLEKDSNRGGMFSTIVKKISTIEEWIRKHNSIQHTKRLISKFSAYKSSQTNNVTGDGTAYTAIFDTEIYDANGDYNNANGVFTAPETGIYRFAVAIYVRGVVGQTYIDIQLVTSNRTYTIEESTIVAGITDYQIAFSVDADMDVGDVASIVVTSGGGAKVVDLYGAASPRVFFQGMQVSN